MNSLAQLLQNAQRQRQGVGIGQFEQNQINRMPPVSPGYLGPPVQTPMNPYPNTSFGGPTPYNPFAGMKPEWMTGAQRPNSAMGTPPVANPYAMTPPGGSYVPGPGGAPILKPGLPSFNGMDWNQPNPTTSSAGNPVAQNRSLADTLKMRGALSYPTMPRRG